VSKKDIGIDLGTANTLIYRKTKGIVINEPSVAALDRSDNKIVCAGSKAKEMLGRTPRGVEAVKPLSKGVIEDFETASAMLELFINKAMGTRSGLKPTAVVAVPAGITAVEKKAVREAVLNAGVRECFLVDEPMAAAIGAELDVNAPSGIMIADIGGGTSEVAVIALGGIVTRRTFDTGGDSMDRAIYNYILRKYGICLGIQSVEGVKNKIGTVMKNTSLVKLRVNGRHNLSGLPQSVCVTGEDIRRAILPEVYKIVDAIRQTLEETPPELCSDILKSGITLTGGGAYISGIDRLICTKTSLPVRIAEAPLESVIRGIGKIVENRKIMKRNFD